MKTSTGAGRRTTAAGVCFGLYVGLAVFLLAADAWAYIRIFWSSRLSDYSVDANPAPRTCAYTLTGQQHQPGKTRYAQVWQVVCTYDRSKSYRPDDYPEYYYVLLTQTPAPTDETTYLPLGALAGRMLSKPTATWEGDELHVATWSGGLMDRADRIDDVAIVYDLKGAPARGRL